MEAFFERGDTDAILEMNIFSVNEFNTLWISFQGFLTEHLNVRRGRKIPFCAKVCIIYDSDCSQSRCTMELSRQNVRVKCPTFWRKNIWFIEQK